jgi:hypothetical protein
MYATLNWLISTFLLYSHKYTLALRPLQVIQEKFEQYQRNQYWPPM